MQEQQIKLMYTLLNDPSYLRIFTVNDHFFGVRVQNQLQRSSESYPSLLFDTEIIDGQRQLVIKQSSYNDDVFTDDKSPDLQPHRRLVPSLTGLSMVTADESLDLQLHGRLVPPLTRLSKVTADKSLDLPSHRQLVPSLTGPSTDKILNNNEHKNLSYPEILMSISSEKQLNDNKSKKKRKRNISVKKRSRSHGSKMRQRNCFIYNNKNNKCGTVINSGHGFYTVLYDGESESQRIRDQGALKFYESRSAFEKLRKNINNPNNKTKQKIIDDARLPQDPESDSETESDNENNLTEASASEQLAIRGLLQMKHHTGH
jgi:hypothetical protein